MLLSRSSDGHRHLDLCSRCSVELQSRIGRASLAQGHQNIRQSRPNSIHSAPRPRHRLGTVFRSGQRRWITRNQIRKIAEADEAWVKRADDIKHGRKRSVLEVLEERGFVNQIVGTREQLKHLLDNRRTGVYAGIDPTAPSMHVGHMVPFMALSWMYVYGYPVYFLLGGATARIGDPEGRLQARSDMGRQTFKANLTNMHMQLKRFGASLERYAARRGYQKEWAWSRALINNSYWQEKTPMTQFLRMMASGVRLGPMLGRDSVKNRQEKGDGMSMAEFTYPLMQAWDWWELMQRGVQVQIGGADQFGNILQGADAVKYTAAHDQPYLERLEQEEKVRANQGGVVVADDPMGWTVPLLTTSSGEKFGKSAGNAVWLDADMTSCFDLYQFFLRSADADVEKYLRLLTFLPIVEVQQIMKEHQQNQSKRIAQHTLAREFVELIHGQEAAEKAEQQHRELFSKNVRISDFQKSVKPMPVEAAPEEGEPAADLHPRLNKHARPQDMHSSSSTQATLPRSLVENQPLSRILYSAGLVASRSEGQRLINAGGVYIGAQSDGKGEMNSSVSYVPAKEASAEFVAKYIIDDNLLILRSGKWKVKIISIISDEDFKTERLTAPGWDPGSGQLVGPGAESQKSMHFDPLMQRKQGRY